MLSLSAEGVVHVIKRELRWGRWQHVQIRLFSELSQMVSVRPVGISWRTVDLPARRPCSFPSPVPPRALRPPGWLPQWHCGVRVSSNKKLVGFISAIPADIRIYDTWALPPHHPPPREAWRADSLPPPPFFPFAPLQSEEDGGDQLLVCPQEAAFEARRSGAHQRDHAEGEPRGDISGRLHSRSGSAQTCVYVQVSYTTHTHIRE